MPNFVCTLFLEEDAAGCSENYFMTSTDYNAAMLNLQHINSARMALCLSTVKSAGLRVSDVEVFRDSLQAAPTAPVGTYAPTGSVQTSYPSLGLRLLCQAGVSLRSVRILRFMPYDQIFGSVYNPSGTWPANLTALVNAMQLYCSISTKRPLSQQPPKYTFTAITQIATHGLSERKIGRPFDLFRGRRAIH